MFQKKNVRKKFYWEYKKDWRHCKCRNSNPDPSLVKLYSACSRRPCIRHVRWRIVPDVVKMRFSKEQRCFIIEQHFLNTRSCVHVRMNFSNELGSETLDMQLKRIIDEFEQHYGIADLTKTRRKCVLRTPAFSKRVNKSEATPTISSRRPVQNVGARHTTTCRVTVP